MLSIINSLIERIKSFPNSTFIIKAGADEQDLKQLENALNLALPQDFKSFLSISNGFSLMGETVYPVKLVSEKDDFGEHLEVIYLREHEEVQNPMPKKFFPFSPNGRGDHYCFDLSNRNEDGTCPVIFWQWDYSYFYPNDIEKTHDSFTNWLQGLISTLQEELNE